jgi:hypothetical protein
MMITRAVMGAPARDTMRIMKHSLFQTLAFDPIPQAVRPVFEGVVNRNGWTGQPIVPYYMEQLDKELQFRPSTSSLARGAAKVFPFSPLKIENFIRGYLGTLGMYGVSAIDLATHNETFGFAERPTAHWTDMWILKRFFKDDREGGYRSQYYDFREQVEMVMKSYRALVRDQRIPEAVEMLQDNPQILRLDKLKRAIDERMDKIRVRRRTVEMSMNMDPESKRVQLDALTQLENMILRGMPQIRKDAGLKAGLFD